MSIKTLIAELENGKLPAAEDIKALCYALHSCMVDKDVPEFLWLSETFENMGDYMHVVIECSKREEAELLTKKV